MLEDCTMDKKSAGRAAQVPCKGNGTDCKKSQDASSTSKSFPRVSRKRETTGSGVPKYDQNRKSQPQKSKIFDKRPRPRGQQFAGGKEDSKVEEEIPEIGPVLGNGSKKLNLNHLLNFHYTPKDGAQKHFHSGPALHGSSRWMHSSQRHKYNKEQFLQANCQFVVKATGDYTRYLNDPDMLVDWDLVEQIRVQSFQLLSCPICLSPPTAARMTRCGHVFCWPCMLHYLALADKTWRKCPICYEAVHRDDLKSVVTLRHAELSVGAVVTMRLMRRERGTLVAMPVEQEGLSATTSKIPGPVALQDVSTSATYCKLLVAKPSQVLHILEQEAAELQQRYKEEEGTPEICFTEQALELLGQRKSGMSEMVEPKIPIPEEMPEDEPQTMPIEVQHSSVIYESAFDNIVQDTTTQDGATQDGATQEAGCIARNRCENMASEEQESSDNAINQSLTELENVSPEDLETPRMLQQAGSDVKHSKYFYFYQAADGQHMYLHSLNARMLEASYGSLEASPTVLKARIVEKEAGSMTAELRHRLRYLQHLPVTCQFEVVELDLRPPLVSRDVLGYFQDQLEQRRRKRQRRAKEERRREKRITEEENKRLGRYPTPRIKIESHHQFPECGIDSSPTKLDQKNTLLGDSSSPSLSDAFQDFNISNNESQSSSGPSFAQMLREGKMQSAPGKHHAPHAGTSQRIEEPDPEGYVPPPSFNQSFGYAFALALEQATATSTSSNIAAPDQDSSNARKKKKNKQKLLFSTSMACNSK